MYNACMSKIGPKEAAQRALAELRANPKLKLIRPKLDPVVKVERQVIVGVAPPPIQMSEVGDPDSFEPAVTPRVGDTISINGEPSRVIAVAASHGGTPDEIIARNDRVFAAALGKPRRGKSRMKVPKRPRGPESSPAGKKQAVLYAPEGECGFCDARRAVSREGMRRLRAKPDHGNVTDAVK